MLKKDFEQTAETSRDTTVPTPAAAKPPVLTLDVALYEQYLVESDLTEDQKREFLEALWSIIVGFVDLGFGIHPVQQAAAAGQDDEKSGAIAAGLIPFQQEESQSGLRAEIAASFAKKEEQ